MSERARWVDEVWQKVAGVFDDQWNAHLRALNTQLGLTDDHRFATHGPWIPPMWFNGDIEALEPGLWVLAISLNPHRVGEPETPSEPQFDRTFTMAEYWDFWRTYNTNHWYRHFYGPLARVAAGALGKELSRNEEHTFATTQMLFLELCPYASPRFGLRPQQVAELAASDIGFRMAHDILHLAAGEGHPALILVNGNAAVAALDTSEGARVQWSEVVYPSASKPDKRLRHWEGTYRAAHGPVPIAGFPFLRTMGGFNSHAEISQLISDLRALVAAAG